MSNFLNSSSKWVVKQQQQLETSITHLAQELLTNIQCSGWPSEVDNDQLRAIIKADPLTTTQEVAERTQRQPFYGHLAFEANWKGEKLSKWMPHELTENKKIFVIKFHLLLCNKEPFLDQIVTCDEKWILYNW